MNELACIFIDCLFAETFHDPLKKQGSYPSPKRGQASFGSYRPISLLLSLSQTFEKIKNRQLLDFFFVLFELLYSFQFRFRDKRLIVDAVAKLSEQKGDPKHACLHSVGSEKGI